MNNKMSCHAERGLAPLGKAGSGSARKKFEKSIELGGRKLTLSTGVLAQQATAAVMASYGDTVVLATVVAAPL
ncbi:MAG: hypothetical protein ABIJ85_04375, partial [bacterium]